MIANVLEMLESSASDAATIPPTILYNEGWLLRLVLALAARGLNGLPFAFQPQARWFSEGLLESPFRPRFRADPLAEGRTHADGVVGHFRVTDRTKAGVELTAAATQFVICEAKMFSALSRGTRRAPTFNQAARNVSCLAWTLAQVRPRRPLTEYTSVGFFILAPESQIQARVFAAEMTRQALAASIEARVGFYDAEHRVAKLDPWLHEWALPLLDGASQFRFDCISWESVIQRIAEQDAACGDRMRSFYAECLRYNAPATQPADLPESSSVEEGNEA